MNYLLTFIMLTYGADALSVGPTIEIKWPEEVSAGSRIIIDASEVDAEKISWQVVKQEDPTLNVFDTLESGRKCVIDSTPGTYYVFVSASNMSGLTSKAKVVKVKSGIVPVPPGPGPDPQPQPKTLKQISNELANKVNSSTRQQDAKTIASNYRVIAAQISNSNMTPEQITELVRTTNKGTLPESLRTKWQAWQEAVSKVLLTMHESGTLTTAKQHADAYNQIADSLETGVMP